MKIKTKEMSYEKVMALPTPKHRNPRKQSPFFRAIEVAVSAGELKKVHFTCKRENLDKLKKGEPCLYLMNHSSFIDLKIAATLIAPKPFHIVCTSDGFVGKENIMRAMGCIPTRKFITDVDLVRDMFYVTKKLNSSILMYPEASYSFDGTATTLPKGLGKCVIKLGIPVVMIKTRGAFIRDPLYNNLQLRNVDVSAVMRCILTKEDLETLSADEVLEQLKAEFSFDQFKNQQEDHVIVNENFRADGLQRVLYKCPSCMAEGKTIGKGVMLTCMNCGKEYILTEQGFMQAAVGRTEFSHIPDWYAWERKCVKEEIKQGTYKLDALVQIGLLKDTKALYMVGDGELVHDLNGFHLTGCEGKLTYYQSPKASYSLYSDYFWYEIGDVICIGDGRMLYYCFPKSENCVVAKARLAAEELYKIVTSEV